MEESLANQMVIENGMCISADASHGLGQDEHGRTLITMYGCYFPSKKDADYNLLLEHCIVRMEPFSLNDYVLIFFAEPMEHRPSISWIREAYRSLERRYKKNLQRLYVLNASCWFHTVIWIMSKIFSDKFARKIHFVNSLEDLGRMVPLQKLFIPPAISGYDRGVLPERVVEEQAELPSIRIFGADLENVAPGGSVPPQILKVVKTLEANGLEEEGIFRLSPDPIQIEQIRMSMDRGYDLDLSIFSIHSVAAAFKAFFRQLPTPLIPQSTHDAMKSIPDLMDDEIPSFLKRKIFAKMNDQQLAMLALIMRLLRKTSEKSKVNMMPSRNLAAVWAPNLVRGESLEDEMKVLAISQRFVELLIIHSQDLLDEYDPISAEPPDDDSETSEAEDQHTKHGKKHR